MFMMKNINKLLKNLMEMIEYASLPEFHRFVIPEGCHWNDVRETTTNVGLAIEKAFTRNRTG